MGRVGFGEGFEDVGPCGGSILPDSAHHRGHARQFGIECVLIEIHHDVFHLFFIEFDFDRPASHDGNHFAYPDFLDEKTGNIEHDIARAHDDYFFSKVVFFLAVRGQLVIVVDQIFGMHHAGQLFAGEAKPFRPLRPGADENGLKTKPAQIVKAEIALRPDGDVAKIGQAWRIQHLHELGAQTLLHHQFIGINSVFGQSARLDIAIKQDHADAAARQFAGGKEARRAGAHHGDVITCFSHSFSP